MSDAISSGAIDVVGLARPLAAQPDLAARLLDGTAAAATPIRLDTGIKRLDAVIQGAWYQTQISRMARGQAPELHLSRLRALIGYFLPRPRGEVVTGPLASREAEPPARSAPETSAPSRSAAAS